MMYCVKQSKLYSRSLKPPMEQKTVYWITQTQKIVVIHAVKFIFIKRQIVLYLFLKFKFFLNRDDLAKQNYDLMFRNFDCLCLSLTTSF